jgi:hypothetical protein
MSFLTSREQVAPQGIGKPVRRREDARLLTGGAAFGARRAATQEEPSTRTAMLAVRGKSSTM